MQDLNGARQHQQQVWASGDYAMVERSGVIMSELLCEAVDVRAGQTVLDVACGSGNTALAAARRFCRVTGVDYVPALLEHGRQRAAVERLDISYIEADAVSLPFPDESFDVVLSTFGVMFAPNQERTASELLRVCRRGGKIGLANWTPDGLQAEFFRVVGRHVPPPSSRTPPTAWGTEERLRVLFGNGIASLRAKRQGYVLRYHSPEHWIEYYRTHFGPILTAFDALDEPGKQALAKDLLDILRRRNQSNDGTLVVVAEYLEAVAFRAGISTV
jgi:SAM-dependent methyltransferase